MKPRWGRKWKHGRGIVLGLGILALFVFTVPAFAQVNTGTILGVVKDTSGGSVAGAMVTVTDTDTNVSRSETTQADGSYRFPQLAVGNYEVQVTKDGFQAVDRKGLTLLVGQEAPIDITLQVGSTGQTIVVNEEAPLVNTTSSAVGNIVDEQQVQNLPLNGRNFTDLSLLQPGVAQNTSQGGPFGITGTFYSSNGAPTRSNNYMLDGAIMQNLFALNNSSIAGTSLGVDGIKEYRVETSMFSAEYPLVMGSQSVIVSKSGTNSLHGSVFEYLRNSSMDARNYFDLLDEGNLRGYGTDKSLTYPGKRIPPFQRNNFGADVGGPIKKDKAFFYATYEGLRENTGLSVVDTTLPAACFTNGTFFGVTTTTEPVGCGSTADETPNTINPVINRMLTEDASGNPFSKSVFPSGALYPAPLLSAGQNNYSYPAIERTSENYGQLRLDETFSSADSAFGRYTADYTHQVVPQSWQQIQVAEKSLSEFATVSETHIFSPSLLNTARFSYSRTGYTILDQILPDNEVVPLVEGKPFGGVSFGGATGWGASGTEGRTAQFVDTVSDDVFYTKGKHSFKFGTLFIHWNSYMDPQFTAEGSISFPDLGTFLQGEYNAAGWAPRASSSVRDYLYDTLGFYAQDDFRITPRLTLNLGMRYEFLAKVPYESSGHNAEIDIATAAPPTFGTLNVPFLKTNPSRHNISPRVGFAWDVFGNGKMSVRGGAGIYYDVASMGSQFVINSLSTEPYSYFYTLTNNWQTDPLVLEPPGTALLDNPALTPAGGCSTIVVPTFTPCAVSTSLWDVKNQPTMAQWNLTIDRQLPWNIGLTAGYIGAGGWHIYRADEINPNNVTITPQGTYIPLQHLANGLPIYCQTGPGEPAGTCLTTFIADNSGPVNGAFGGQAALNIISNLQNFQHLNPFLSSGSSAEPEGNISYHSFQLTLTKRMSNGLSFESAYTFAKDLDSGSSIFFADGRVNATSGNVDNVDRGPTEDSIKHLYRFNATYAIPGPRSERMWAKALTGWNVAAILSLQTGYPLTPTMTTCARPVFCDGGVSALPDRSPTFNSSTINLKDPNEWFDPTMFALPAAGQIGNSGRGDVIGPDVKNLDFSPSKDFKLRWLGEQGAISFRADFFNIFNHPQFAAPNTQVYNNPGDATLVTTPPGPFVPASSSSVYAAFPFAGLVTATSRSSRQVQLSLRASF